MRRQGFRRLYARLISFHWAAGNARCAHRDLTGTPVSPILATTAIVLFLILAILEIDLHGDELRALGLIFSEDGIEPILLASP
jgi:hypothetical protein